MVWISLTDSFANIAIIETIFAFLPQKLESQRSTKAKIFNNYTIAISQENVLKGRVITYVSSDKLC